MGFLAVKGVKGAAVEAANPPKRCPAPPSWLAPHAKKEWKRAGKELHTRGLLADDMLATLESYCIAVGQVREFEETMRAEGRTVKVFKEVTGLEGKTELIEVGVKVHPAFRMQGNAMREARLLAAELSLTPHRRGLKGNPEGGDDDGWDPDLLP